LGVDHAWKLTDDRNCTANNQAQPPGQNQWGAPVAGWNNNPGGNWPQPGLVPPLVPARPNSPATFDGKDRITIKEGWFLIRGDGSFFVEHAGTGLDLPAKDMSYPARKFELTVDLNNLMKLLQLPEPPAPPAPPVVAPIPQGPHPVGWGQQQPAPMGPVPMGGAVPMGAPVPMGINPPIPAINPPIPMAGNPNVAPPLGFHANPQMPFNPAMMPLPMPAPQFQNPMQAAAMAHPPQGHHHHHPQMMMQPPIPMPNGPAPMQAMQQAPQMPGVAHISPPLGGNMMAGAVFAQGLQPLPLPKIEDGRPGETVLPNYTGFNLTTTGNGPPTITIKPNGGPVDIPWGWN